jgi:hypothetical protein
MQPTKLFLNILLALMMTACDRSCSDGLEPLTELPPETQSGANTFGCLLNGKLFVPRVIDYTLFPDEYDVTAYYRQYDSIFGLEVYGDLGALEFSTKYITENITTVFNRIYFSAYSPFTNGVETILSYGGENIGEIYITHLDTVTKTASGIFSGEIPLFMYYSKQLENLDTILMVTSGRFDVRLKLYY